MKIRMFAYQFLEPHHRRSPAIPDKFVPVGTGHQQAPFAGRRFLETRDMGGEEWRWETISDSGVWTLKFLGSL